MRARTLPLVLMTCIMAFVCFGYTMLRRGRRSPADRMLDVEKEEMTSKFGKVIASKLVKCDEMKIIGQADDSSKTTVGFYVCQLGNLNKLGNVSNGKKKCVVFTLGTSDVEQNFENELIETFDANNKCQIKIMDTESKHEKESNPKFTFLSAEKAAGDQNALQKLANADSEAIVPLIKIDFRNRELNSKLTLSKTWKLKPLCHVLVAFSATKNLPLEDFVSQMEKLSDSYRLYGILKIGANGGSGIKKSEHRDGGSKKKVDAEEEEEEAVLGEAEGGDTSPNANIGDVDGDTDTLEKEEKKVNSNKNKKADDAVPAADIKGKGKTVDKKENIGGDKNGSRGRGGKPGQDASAPAPYGHYHLSFIAKSCLGKK